MKLGFFNGNLLKKGTFKTVRKAIAGVLVAATILASGLVGCASNIANSNANTNVNTTSSDNYVQTEVNQTTTSTGTYQKPTMDYDRIPIYNGSIDTTKDVSDDYITVYAGPLDGPIVASGDNIVRYKNSSNAFTRDKSGFVDTSVTMSDEDYYEFMEFLDEQDTKIPYSELFNVEHLLEKNDNKTVNHHGKFELVNGQIDANRLYEVVKYNNDHYNYSNTFTKTELVEICNILAKNLNYSLKYNPYMNQDSLLCILSDLKIFKENNVTNARITDDFVLAISPNMIANLQQRAGDLVNAFELTISHEGGHFGQLNCDDEVDKNQTTKIGFNQKWENEPINSLYWNWYFEASAESMMMNVNKADNLVYSTQINYLKYLEMVLSLKSDFNLEVLENVSVSRDREDFFNLFGNLDKKDKVRLCEMMYAIELIQNENEDFEKVYLSYTNKNAAFLQSDEWVQIKRELKAGIAANLSKMFYKNLAELVRTNKLTLNDVYHIITVFEAEIESHNTYDSIGKFGANMAFMDSYISMQDAFFGSVTTSYSYDEVVQGFDNYSYRDGATMNGLNDQSRTFIENRKDELRESTTTNIKTFYSTFSAQYDKNGALTLG